MISQLFQVTMLAKCIPEFKLVSAVRRLQEKNERKNCLSCLKLLILLIQLLCASIRMGRTAKVKAILSG